MEKKPIAILWKRPDGGFSQDPPTEVKTIASTISKGALKRLAEKYNIFVLELVEDGQDIAVEKI